MTFAEVLDYREKLESRVNTYWSVFGVSVLAVVGWLFTISEDNPLSTVEGAILSAGLGAFFLANLGSIIHVTRIVAEAEKEIALRGEVEEVEFKNDLFLRSISSPFFRGRIWLSVGLHILIDVGVLTVVWLQVLKALDP